MPHDRTDRPLTDDRQSLTGGGGQLDAVARLLLTDCTADELVSVLGSGAGDVVRAAIACLGLRGSLTHCRTLAGLLRHDDPELVALAENGLWRIWMRAGSAWGNAQLAQAVDLIRRSRFSEAIGVLEGLSATEPTFAESHHQRGISLSFLDRPDEAAGAFRQTLRLNRYHFSAALNLGHMCVEQGDLKAALRHYRHALRIHPRLEGIPEAVARLKAVVGDGSVSH